MQGVRRISDDETPEKDMSYGCKGLCVKATETGRMNQC